MDESFPRPAGEDTEWTTRMRLAGYTLFFEPRAVIHHHHSRNTFRQILEHAFYFGRNSVKVDPRYFDVIQPPTLMRHYFPLLLLSPALAAGATARIFWRGEILRSYWSAVPAVFLTKMSWCLGAATRLRSWSRLQSQKTASDKLD
jgi:GT2 family glycosyltransferase